MLGGASQEGCVSTSRLTRVWVNIMVGQQRIVYLWLVVMTSHDV